MYQSNFGSPMTMDKGERLHLTKFKNTHLYNSNFNNEKHIFTNYSHFYSFPISNNHIFPNDNLIINQNNIYTPFINDIYNTKCSCPNTSYLDNSTKNQDKISIIKKPFTNIEDQILLSLVKSHGPTKWQKISLIMREMNFNRNGRQCRDRYFHYLNPQVNTNLEWSPEEDELLNETVLQNGKKWKSFEQIFPGRTEVSLRNRYNLLIRKKNKKEKNTNKKMIQKTNELCMITNQISNNNLVENGDENALEFDFEMLNYSFDDEIEFDNPHGFNFGEKSNFDHLFY